MSVRVKF